MHSKFFACAAVVAFAVAELFAQAAPPAVAPAGTTTNIAGAQVTWYGMAMFRFRDEIVTDKSKTETAVDSATFTNQLGYKLGAKVKANDQLSMQFEIGNDWYATDKVGEVTGNIFTKRDPNAPYFDLAFAQWDPGYMHIAAGIIPVRGTPLMDLLGMSILYGKRYKTASWLPWGVVTNFSQTGLRIGAPIVKGPITIGIDGMTSVIENRNPPSSTSLVANASAIEALVDVPITCGGLTVTPQGFIIPNRSYNSKNGTRDMEGGAGFDFGYKLDATNLIRGGFGYAQNSNKNSRDMTLLPTPEVAFDRSGMNANVGTTLLLGPGKFDFDFTVSTEKDANDPTVNDVYPFLDFKYGWAVNKNFVICPRIRFFMGESQAATAIRPYDTRLTTRPELIFTGVF